MDRKTLLLVSIGMAAAATYTQFVVVPHWSDALERSVINWVSLSTQEEAWVAAYWSRAIGIPAIFWLVMVLIAALEVRPRRDVDRTTNRRLSIVLLLLSIVGLITTLGHATSLMK